MLINEERIFLKWSKLLISKYEKGPLYLICLSILISELDSLINISFLFFEK